MHNGVQVYLHRKAIDFRIGIICLGGTKLMHALSPGLYYPKLLQPFGGVRVMPVSLTSVQIETDMF